MPTTTDSTRNEYYRAIIVDRGDLSAVAAADKVFGKRAKEKESLSAGALCRVRLESPTRPPSYLEQRLPQRTKGDTVLYSYDLCVSDIVTPASPGLLVAGPIRKVLGELQSSGKYFWLDLSAICDDQFTAQSDTRVTVSRLHLRLYGERAEAASSTTIYGRDVVKSRAVRDLLRGRRIDVTRPPFQRLATLKKTERSLDVSSCRLVWDDGHQRFALNVDHFGNFSFRFTGPQSVDGINALLDYAHQQRALGVTDLDPTRRSDASMTAVQDEATDND